MRRQKEVSTSVLGSRARWFESVPQRSNAKNPAPLKIKELWVKERRYIVCLNEEERRKDAHDREAIVGHLKEQLRYGDKSLVGNKGYRLYLKVEGSGHFVIDEKRSFAGWTRCNRSKPTSRADAFYSVVSSRRMLRKRCVLPEWQYRRLYARSSDSIQAGNVVPRPFLTLRKSFNGNNLIFRTVEDGLGFCVLGFAF